MKGQQGATEGSGAGEPGHRISGRGSHLQGCEVYGINEGEEILGQTHHAQGRSAGPGTPPDVP